MNDNERLTLDAKEIILGLIYVHRRAESNTAEVLEANSAVQALVELLVEQGVIDAQTLNTRAIEVTERLRGKYIEQRMGMLVQEFGVGKYEFQNEIKIDCASRIHLCGAVCCRLPFALSLEDVQEGIVRWHLGEPYCIARGEDGYCVHLNRQTLSCYVYGQRPVPCRGYDCRQDRRVWLDFDAMVANPRIHDPKWPE